MQQYLGFELIAPNEYPSDCNCVNSTPPPCVSSVSDLPHWLMTVGCNVKNKVYLPPRDEDVPNKSSCYYESFCTEVYFYH